MPTRPTFSAVPVDKPLPLYFFYPLIFSALYLSHYTLLHLPYFWDEAGYYIPAALDFFRTGALVPQSTLTNAHPPLPSVLLSAWWHLSGLAIAGTRTFVCMVAAAALLGVFRLARLLAGTLVAGIVTFVTALYPVWFAQSTLAHADIFAAAFSLWALSFYFERHTPSASTSSRHVLYVAALFSLAALSKETAIVTPVVLALWEAVQLIVPSSTPSSEFTPAKPSPVWIIALVLPTLPLAAWYLFHFHKTGYVFGNPEFLRYNATANLTLARVLVSLWHRLVHLTVHMNMYVPVVATLAVLLMPRVSPRFRLQPALLALAVVLAGNALAFSILGGALLTRYLLPLYPLILLLCVATWQSRSRPRGLILWTLSALTSAGFLAGLWVNPPYSIAPEDNLTYRDMIVLHQEAVAVINRQFPYATVLTAWPAVAELQYPDLGYTPHPIKIFAIDNFSRDQIGKAAADPGSYDTALVFSTKWTPPSGRLNLGTASESNDSRYFDFHRDLSPREIAAQLQGEIVWQRYRNGEWAAVLHFPRSVEARLLPPRR